MRRQAILRLALPLLTVLAATGCRMSRREAVALAPQHQFRATRKPVISSPVAWDFDGNGTKEIAIGSWDGYFYLLDADLNPMPGWPKHSPKGFFSSPALVDLDGDGVPDILVGAESGKIFAWRYDGSSVPGFPADLGAHVWASPAVLEGPRFAIGDLEKMWVLDAQGKPVPGWPQPMVGWPAASAATDGTTIAVTTLIPGDPSEGRLYAWTANGELLAGFPVYLSLDSDSSPALADLDGDGTRWIVVGDDAGYLHVVDLAAQPRPGFPTRSQGPAPGMPTPTPHPPGGNIHSIEASPALADLTGDGRIEIVVGSWDGQLYVWNDAGDALPGWPKRVGDQIISSAALVDLNGDDRLDIVVGSKDGFLYGWTVEAEPLPGFPYDLGAPVFSSPWVGDLHGDGRADIVVGANNGIHLLRDVGPLGRAAWPMFHANERRSGMSE
jgi:WD40 repeat protein